MKSSKKIVAAVVSILLGGAMMSLFYDSVKWANYICSNFIGEG